MTKHGARRNRAFGVGQRRYDGRSMRRKGGMKGLASLVPGVFPARSPYDRRVMMLFSQWCRCVPERVSSQAQPVRVRGGQLTVHTRSAAWANLLQLESESILATLRSRYPQCGVNSLAFRQGPFPELPIPPPPKAPPPPVRPAAMLPETVARQLARIRNDSVRDAVARAVAMGLGEQVIAPSTGEPATAAKSKPGPARTSSRTGTARPLS